METAPDPVDRIDVMLVEPAVSIEELRRAASDSGCRGTGRAGTTAVRHDAAGPAWWHWPLTDAGWIVTEKPDCEKGERQ